MARAWVGTSGWSYKHWKGVFYPETLASREWFPFYVKKFNTVEVNNTFYRMPAESMVKRWAAVAPDDFLLTFKANREITHRRKLVGTADILRDFLGRLTSVGDKLGVILFQLPPSLRKDIARLSELLSLLPAGRRYAIEFRHDSWNCDEVWDLLRERDVAYCIASAPKLEPHIIATTSFVYMRMHGPSGWYNSDYPEEELKSWASHARQFLAKQKDVFVYFNNDIGGYAVRNAQRLRELIEEA